MKIKLIILIAAVLLAMASKAQNFRVNLEGGYSLNNCPVFGAGAGYNFGPVGVQAGFQAHASTLVTRGAFMNVGLFKEVRIADTWFLAPAIMYSYHYKSADNKSLNSPHPMYVMEIQKELIEGEMRVGFKAARSGEYTLLSLSVIGTF